MAAFCLFIPSKGSIRYLARLTPTRRLKSCCFQWEGSGFQWGSRNLGIHLGVTLVSEGCETGGWNEEWSWGSLFSCLFFWLRWQVKGKREMEMEISPLPILTSVQTAWGMHVWKWSCLQEIHAKRPAPLTLPHLQFPSPEKCSSPWN